MKVDDFIPALNVQERLTLLRRTMELLEMTNDPDPRTRSCALKDFMRCRRRLRANGYNVAGPYPEPWAYTP